jgi:hypothetical protein
MSTEDVSEASVVRFNFVEKDAHVFRHKTDQDFNKVFVVRMRIVPDWMDSATTRDATVTR